MHKLSFFNYSAAWFQLGLSRSLSPKSAPNMGWSKCVFHLPEFEAIKALLQAPLHFAADSWPINLELFLSLILEVNYPWCSNHLPRLSYHISPLSSYLHNQTSFQLSFNYLKIGAFLFFFPFGFSQHPSKGNLGIFPIYTFAHPSWFLRLFFFFYIFATFTCFRSSIEI